MGSTERLENAPDYASGIRGIVVLIEPIISFGDAQLLDWVPGTRALALIRLRLTTPLPLLEKVYPNLRPIGLALKNALVSESFGDHTCRLHKNSNYGLRLQKTSSLLLPNIELLSTTTHHGSEFRKITP